MVRPLKKTLFYVCLPLLNGHVPWWGGRGAGAQPSGRQGPPPAQSGRHWGSVRQTMYYSWCHENGSLSLHSFNQHNLSVPQYTGSWGNSKRNTR